MSDNNSHNNEIREAIRISLQSFENKSLREASLDLLTTLGYQSDKTIMVPGATPKAFLKLLAEHNPEVSINKDKALFNDWTKAEVLFQLTDEELSHEASLFTNDSVNSGLLQSYVFFAIELKQRDYARGKLTAIARQLNRVFPMPVMVFIKHRDLLSIAVINRRLHKRDSEKDVLGKVTIIRDISLQSPHRGHLDILSSFALPSLIAKTAIFNFDTLHAAWEEIFNVELLNKRFYKELANWYFWALPQVDFPADMESNDDRRRATGLIRLLTRLIFCWFLKEKGLIPDRLFDQNQLKERLANLDAESSSFYLAILQNLFFATLNQRMGKDSKGKYYRRFVTEKTFQGKNKEHGVTTLYRHKKLFRNSETAPALFEDIPFLNGGLFECLDREDETNKNRMIRVDGFSENKKNQPIVLNLLFFSPEIKGVDLSDIYGDKKRKNETVSGLIHILDRYKFTIVENTPIDQEIALDPELLGKVFENLLASYNEETKTTARKQTGSFYTPRPIVDYMVDESLKAHLTAVLGKEHGMLEEDARAGLDILFAYTEKECPFEGDEVDTLIRAIDTCKVLDPACGSGAFPMGMLHKLVYILAKLDHDNGKWKQTQLNKLDSVSMREDLERIFENNNDDYGRKLYLIENCLYGVDIQPIAIQLSKLRFFISLICDQKTNRNKAQNHGIRPLPNLETKFVAADTLISLDKAAHIGLAEHAQSDLFDNVEIDRIENDLQQVRHNYFAAQTRQKKLALQKKDKKLREQLAEELMRSAGADQVTSRNLADWDPYDPRVSAEFFEPIWMFDRSIADGFDVVIGNPPYIQIQKFPKAQKDIWVSQQYEAYAATADIYCLFYERGSALLREGGHLCYITSNKWMRAGYGEKLRNYLATSVNTTAVLDFGMAQNFGAATTYTCILNFIKEPHEDKTRSCYASDDRAAMADPEIYFRENSAIQKGLGASPWVVLSKERQRIKSLVEAQGVPLKDWDIQINYGIKTGFNDAYYITTEQRNALIAEDPACEEIIVPLLRGRFVDRYATSWDGTWMLYVPWHFPLQGDKSVKGPSKRAEQLFSEQYPVVYRHLLSHKKKLSSRNKAETGIRYEWYALQRWAADYHEEFQKQKIIYPNMTKYLPFYYDEKTRFYTNDKGFIITSSGDSLTYLTAFLNSHLFRCCYRDNFPELMGNTYEVRKIFVDQIPVKKPSHSQEKLFNKLVTMIQLAKQSDEQASRQVAQFLEDLIDACVMEVYFSGHMAEKDLQVLDDTEALLTNYDPEATETRQQDDLTGFYQKANASDHPIRNRLLRLTADSPDLLAVIKNEGKV